MGSVERVGPIRVIGFAQGATMSLLANMEHLASASGVVAVTIDSPQHPRAFRGAEAWSPVLEASLDLFTRTDEDTIRLVIGQHTIIVQKEHGQTVAVVLPTGHAIAKSLRRMIRRLSKKDRGPVQPPRSSVISAGTTTGTGSSTGESPNAAPIAAAAGSSQRYVAA